MTMKLVGRALDAVVAERVMGWRIDDPEEDAWVKDANTLSGRTFGAHVSEWSPSTDIAAAMEVVEKMRADGWSFASTLYEGQLPYASFCKGTAKSSRNAQATTLPEAICRAALAAVSTQPENDRQITTEERHGAVGFGSPDSESSSPPNSVSSQSAALLREAYEEIHLRHSEQ